MSSQESHQPEPPPESVPASIPVSDDASAPNLTRDPHVQPDPDPSPQPDPSQDPDPTPTPAVLDRIATPAVVRRAPRYWAFIRAGILLGAIAGAVAAALTPGAGDEPRAAVIILTALSLAALGALLGGAFAVLADRRSRAGR